MEAERTRVGVARERALVIQQEAQTEHQRAVMAVWPTFPTMASHAGALKPLV